METKILRPNLQAEIKDRLRSKGYPTCAVAYYSTKQSNVLSGVIHEAKLHTLNPDSLVSIEVFTERADVYSVHIQAHVINNKPTAVLDETPRHMYGAYIRIMCPFDASEDDQLASKTMLEIDSCAALIALMHGELVGLEKHFSMVVNLETEGVYFESENFLVRQTVETEHFNQDIARIIDETRDCNFSKNDRCLSFLRVAHQKRDSSIKFLFLWFAIKSILGDRKKRKRFALEEMSSTLLTNVIKKLHDLRGELLHDGVTISLSQVTYLFAKCVLLIGFCNNLAMRAGILRYLEGLVAENDFSAVS